MSARRWSSRLSAAMVAAIAAVASYSHMRHLALRCGQEDLIATLLPLSVDGLVMVGAVAIGDGRRHTWSAWVAFWTGVGASIAANVLAARPDLIARVVSAWPAIALLLVVEVLSRSGRSVAVAGPVPADVHTPAPLADEGQEQIECPPAASTRERLALVLRRMPDANAEQLAEQLGVSSRTVRRYLSAGRDGVHRRRVDPQAA